MHLYAALVPLRRRIVCLLQDRSETAGVDQVDAAGIHAEACDAPPVQQDTIAQDTTHQDHSRTHLASGASFVNCNHTQLTKPPILTGGIYANSIYFGNRILLTL